MPSISLRGDPCPKGDIGELAVCGYVTPGYYRAPELDAEAFDRDGYFLTGDLGTIEADGRIPFRGRLKEMNKTGGVNVAPLEVEQIKFKLLHLGGHGARQLNRICSPSSRRKATAMCWQKTFTRTDVSLTVRQVT